MRADVKESWVATLKTDRFKQARHYLGYTNTNKRCCLGVLCELAVDAGVIPPPGLKAYDEEILYYGDSATQLPDAVIEWAGIETNIPEVTRPDSNNNITLIYANDALKLSFAQIAELIDKDL